jgi:hypothetical protein
MRRNFKSDERGVSTVVTHVLAIAITSLLVISLLLATGSYLRNQQELVAESELKTIGNRLANELEQVDRLSSDGGNVTLTSEHPSRVAGNTYDVRIGSGSDCSGTATTTSDCLILTIKESDIRQEVPLRDATGLALRRVKPGEFRLSTTGAYAGGVRQQAGTVNLPMTVGVGRDVDPDTIGSAIDPDNSAPFPIFSFTPGSPHSESDIRFDASGSEDIDGEIDKYYWNFKANKTNTWTETSTSSITHDYASDPGWYAVELGIEDDDGAIANISQSLVVSGLEYNGDMDTVTSSSVEFTMKNEWDSREVYINAISIDPANGPGAPSELDWSDDDEAEILMDVNDDGSIESRWELDDHDLATGGVIVDQSSAEDLAGNLGDDPIGTNEEVSIRIRGFDEPVEDDPISLGIQHRIGPGGIGSVNNSTVFRDVPGGVQITDYRLNGTGQDVNLVFNASEQLTAIEINLKGDADNDYGTSGDNVDLTRSDFTERAIAGDYQYFVNVSDGTNGDFTATLHAVTPDSGDVGVTASRSVASTAGYIWNDDAHWDDATSESHVVHANYGGHDADWIQLGYPKTESDLDTYYPFDETSGTTANDVTGNGHDAIHNDDPQTGDSGVFGTSYEFDGDEDYVVDGNAYNYIEDKEAVTVSAWIKSDVDGTNRGVMFGKDPDSTDTSIGFRYDTSGADTGCSDCLKAGLTVGSDETHHESASNEQTTSWQHVVLTWDSSVDSGDLRMYIDGSEDTNGQDSGFEDNTGEIDGISKLIIGQGAKDTGSDDGWDGKIDEVRIYDRALSSSEVQDLYETAKEGSLTTDWQTGSKIKGQDLVLKSEADLDPSDTVRVKVIAETGATTKESDWITLSDGTNSQPVPGGINGQRDKYKLKIDIDAGSVSTNPTIKSLEIKDGS